MSISTKKSDGIELLISKSPTTLWEPVIWTEPENSCVSSVESPNLVEPLEKLWVVFVTDELTMYSCAVIEPDVAMLPWTNNVESIVVAPNDAVSVFCKKEPVLVETT